jgi:peptide/nickel transport system substrate-binding protein
MEKERLHPLVHDLLDQNRQGKISRREFLRFSALLGLSVGAATSLGGFAPLRSAWAQTPKRGGTLKIAALVQKITHPAQLAWPEPTNQLRQVAQHLTLTDFQNITHPYLLKKWEVSDDLKTWTLHLQEGVKFNNGDEFTAEDVVFTIGQWLDPEVKSAMLGLIGGYLDKSGLEKAGKYTVKLNLKKPEIGVPEHLYSYQCVMLNHKTFEGDFLKAPHGTGPYTLEALRPGEICILKARADHWQKGFDGKPLPYLDKMEFVDLGKDMAPRIAALKSGEVHMVDQGSQMSPDVMLAVKGDANFYTHVVPSATTKLLRMRCDQAPFNDNRVRQALKLCQNREKIRALAFQNTGLIGQDCHVYELHPEYCKVETPKFDPQKAKALLAEAGHGNGLEVELFVGSMFPNAIRQAEILKEDAAAAGFRIKITPTPQYFEKWTTYNLGISPWGHRPLGTMTLNLAYTADAEGKPVPWNETHWIDKEFQEVLGQANQTLNIEKRRALFCKLQKIQQERGSIGVVVFEDMFLVCSSKVHNIKNIRVPYLNIDEAWLA